VTTNFQSEQQAHHIKWEYWTKWRPRYYPHTPL